MSDGENTPAAPPAAPKPKRRRRAPVDGNAAPRKRAAKKAAAPAPQPAPQAATPAPASASGELNKVIMEQTAESLAQLSANLASAMTRANQVFSTAFLEQSKDPTAWKHDPLGVQTALNEVWSHLAMQPETLRDAHAQLWQRYGEIWQRHAAQTFTGRAPNEADMPRDKRFRDPEWRTNPAFSMLRETYLATADFITELVQKAEGVDEEDKRKASFFIKQAVDAASPSNFLMTNPTALRALLSSHGESLKKGIDQLAEDLKRGRGNLAISQTDLDAFRVGENVATSPGKVVFRNRLFELLQYDPSTETVHEVPLLIFPPWINKFYILDLQPKNSMIRWLTARGHTVFLVSWVNPDEDLSNASFEDYMRDGVYAAAQAVQDAAGVQRINAVGYCIGGTLLAATLAHMAASGDDRIQSATFFASQADFAFAGDLKVFTDEAGLKYLEDKMEAAGGVLDANTMAATFNSLRANDLVWNYVVDNYYLCKEPPPFDLLYWNADAPRMPSRRHSEYLRRLVLNNDLAEGRYRCDGRTAALSDIRAPIFAVATLTDHVAPWRSVHKIHLLTDTEVTFVLTTGGHNAGIVSEPGHPRRSFQVMARPESDLYLDRHNFEAQAPRKDGSWWPEWTGWLAAHSGEPVAPPAMGAADLPPLDDAPGRYVLAQ